MSVNGAGVYVITAPSGRQYVGSSIDLRRRLREHRNALRRGTHCSKKLQAVWNKYGESLQFSVLFKCSARLVVFYEQRTIDVLKPALNTAPVAGSTTGYRHTAETKARFSERPLSYGHAGKTHSEATKTQISEAKRGRPSNRKGVTLSATTKEKLRAALAGRVNTPEQIEKQKRAFAETIRLRRLGRDTQ